MRTTYTCSADETIVNFATASGSRHAVRLGVAVPAQVERSTGSLRAPELMVDLPAVLVSELVAESPSAPGPVIGVLVHLVTRRATAIGPFESAERAMEWWDQPFNRLASNTDVLFLLASPAEAGVAVAPSSS